MTTRGLGGLVQFTRTRFIARSGRRLMFRSSDTAVELDSALVAAGARAAGFPWGPVATSLRGVGGYGQSFSQVNITNINIYNSTGIAPLHTGTQFSNVNLALHNENFRGGTTV